MPQMSTSTGDLKEAAVEFRKRVQRMTWSQSDKEMKAQPPL
jgi:hypothetical protein